MLAHVGPLPMRQAPKSCSTAGDPSGRPPQGPSWSCAALHSASQHIPPVPSLLPTSLEEVHRQRQELLAQLATLDELRQQRLEVLGQLEDLQHSLKPARHPAAALAGDASLPSPWQCQAIQKQTQQQVQAQPMQSAEQPYKSMLAQAPRLQQQQQLPGCHQQQPQHHQELRQQQLALELELELELQLQSQLAAPAPLRHEQALHPAQQQRPAGQLQAWLPAQPSPDVSTTLPPAGALTTRGSITSEAITLQLPQPQLCPMAMTHAGSHPTGSSAVPLPLATGLQAPWCVGDTSSPGSLDASTSPALRRTTGMLGSNGSSCTYAGEALGAAGGVEAGTQCMPAAFAMGSLVDVEVGRPGRGGMWPPQWPGANKPWAMAPGAAAGMASGAAPCGAARQSQVQGNELEKLTAMLSAEAYGGPAGAPGGEERGRGVQVLGGARQWAVPWLLDPGLP